MTQPQSKQDIRAESAWNHLVQVLSRRIPEHLTSTARARKALNALHRGNRG
jgi:hypothetical protein